MSVDLAEAISLPPEEAIRWFRQKGYTISWNWQETLAEANARAFTVAKVSSLDLLKDIRSAVDQALAEGKTERWFQQTLTPVLQKAGWWGDFLTDRADGGEQRVRLGSPARLRLIYRQNLQTAYMVGRWQEQLLLRQQRPYLQYVAVMDSRTRKEHAVLNGLVFRFDDPIWRSHYPPNGWGCRCRVRQLSESALKRRGLKVESSEGWLSTKRMLAGTDYQTGTKTFTDVTGVKVPDIDREFFTDPGFSYHPGQATFQPMLDRYPEDIARQYVQGVVTGPEFERWFSIWQQAVAAEVKTNPRQTARQTGVALSRDSTRRYSGMEYPVGVLKGPDREALQTPSQTVYLSTGSLVEHLAAHPDIGLAEYQLIPQLLDEGQVYKKGDERLVLLHRQNRLYLAALKVDQARERVYFLSLYQVTEADAKRKVIDKLERLR